MQTKQTQVAPWKLYSRGVSMRKSAISVVPPTTNNLTSIGICDRCYNSVIQQTVYFLDFKWSLRFVLYIRPNNARSQPRMEPKLTFASFPGPAQLFRTGKQRKAERGLGTIFEFLFYRLSLLCDKTFLAGQRIAGKFGCKARPTSVYNFFFDTPRTIWPPASAHYRATKEICSNQSSCYECKKMCR